MQNLIEKLIEYFKKPEAETKSQAPEGLCPVCWGYGEYDKKIRKIYKDKQIDVNNKKDSFLIIQDFVVNYIEGIKLKEGEVKNCPKCSCEEKSRKEGS